MKAATGGNQHKRTPRVGMVEWFRPRDHDQVERVLEDMRVLGIQDLRVGISWADWYSSEGDGWYAWLLPRLARDVRVLPCVSHTPPSLGVVPKFSSPPLVPKSYADFLDVMITRFGEHFEWMELWNQPDNPHEWDARLDPDWSTFSEMIGGAAYWVRKRGKKVVLPGLLTTKLEWLTMLQQRGVLAYIDAIGLNGFPNTTEVPWRDWSSQIGEVRETLAKLKLNSEVWITQTGFSTWRGDERAQVRAFADVLNAPVERAYWWRLHDYHPRDVDSFHSDQREYHYGVKREDGHPKVLFELWAESGLDAVRDPQRLRASSARGGSRKKHTLITGGAGFIGTNLASRLLAADRSVLILDNLSRDGADRNLAWLQETYPKGLQVEIADVNDATAVGAAVRSASEVFHFAAQVAVTSSLVNPRQDHDVNIGGTLTVLEAIRALDQKPPILFTSTNKVYGGLKGLAFEEAGTRYQPLDPGLRMGIDESCPLDFQSPYGCSKGAADQYVLDYARTFGIPAAVFRMSCIYGLHQNGTEDQGWVAHFLLRALQEKPITIYGDGKQVRDLLFVDDLVDAFLLAQSNIQSLSGQAFNMGGGLGNIISLLDLLALIENVQGRAPRVQFKGWRASDQRYYVSDTRKFTMATGWAPIVNVQRGVKLLYQWLFENRLSRSPKLPNVGVRDAVLAG